MRMVSSLAAKCFSSVGTQLTAKAHSRASIEGQKAPAGADGFPSLRMEFLGVGAVEVFATVHGGNVVADDCSCGDENGGMTIRAAAKWEDGVYERSS